MSVILIAAMSRNRVIGLAGTIPWHLPEDLKRFRTLTTGHTILMGRKTWDSLPRRPLPGRHNMVMTRQTDASLFPDATICSSMAEAHAEADARGQDLFVIGGSEIYEQTIAFADRIELTEVDLVIAAPGCAFLPNPDDHHSLDAAGEWQVSSTGLRYRYLTYR